MNENTRKERGDITSLIVAGALALTILIVVLA